jgi:hypothetical protein
MTNLDMRPRGFGEILDHAFAMYRNDFTGYFLAALIPSLPIIAVYVVLGVMLKGASDVAGTFSAAQLLMMPYSVLSGLMVWGAVTYRADRAYHGETASLGQSYGAVFRRFFPLLATVVLLWIAVIVGMVFLIIPGLLLLIMFFGAMHASLLEGRGPVAALGRSRALARGAWGRIAGIIFILSIITSLPGIVLGVAGALGLAAIDPAGLVEVGGALPFAMTQVVATALYAVTMPLLAIGLLVLYYDRRIRQEGLDLQLGTEQLPTIA